MARRTMYFLAALICTLTGILVSAMPTQNCSNSPMDILFLLDSSETGRSPNFNAEKQFVHRVVESLANGNNSFGLVTFGTNVDFQFYLNTYQSTADLLTALPYIWYNNGQGIADKALAVTMDTGFLPSNGDRPEAPNVIVMLTHQSFKSKTGVSSLSRKLETSGIDLYLIEMDAGINDAMAGQLVSGNNMFTAGNLSDLSNLVSSLSERICEGRGYLQQWQPWSQCGTTCGPGLRRRTRTCLKRYHSDADCRATIMEEKSCNNSKCTAPVDGGWTYWGDWTACSRSCGNGTQVRRRDCKAPVPENGGRHCKGSASQARDCSQWACPDCNRKCPPGGRLSDHCDICECYMATLFGTVRSTTNRPLDQVDVFLASRMYSPVGSTDQLGMFLVSSVCMVGEAIVFKRSGFQDDLLNPVQINSTHWAGNVSLEPLVSPVFTQNPQDKVRLVGQSATLCCAATGSPRLQHYTWFKDNEVLDGSGNNGTLIFPNLKITDAGSYRCQVENEAGLTLSESAKISVSVGINTCSQPLAHMEKLPPDCFFLDGSNKVSSVNTGLCPNTPCVTSSLSDNGTCSNWWQHHCCVAGASEVINITCNGFSYQMNRVKSCSCQGCSEQSTIAGKAFGRDENGTEVPFAYGYIYVHGRKLGVTNSKGMFRLTVPTTAARVVLHFVDETFNRFVETTKIVATEKGIETSVTLTLPLKPKPVQFNPALGIDVQLGASSQLPAAGSLSIPDNSLIDASGQPFKGSAKAFVHFMDPRKMHDLESANGDFVYETPDGERGPLETFGMFHVGVEDHHGNQLQVNKPMQFSLDASLFNVSVDENGEPDLALWYYDVNKGIWVETGKMRFSTGGSGRRRLLDTVVVGSFSQTEIPQIDLTEEKTTVKRVIVGYTNCDHSVPIYRDRKSTTTSIRRNACYVGVSVYKDMTLTSREGGGTQVVAVTQDGSRFIGMDRQNTNTFGHACLSIFCQSKVYLYAEDKEDGSRLLASEKHDLPVWYGFNNTKSSTEVVFEAKAIGEVGTSSGIRYSPVVAYEERVICERNHDKNFKFQFAPFTKAPSLMTTTDRAVYDDRLSWYPVSQGKPTAKACFLKISVKVKDYDVRVVATSYQDGRTDGGRYGTYNVGPIPKRSSGDLTTRAACVEFRCAGVYRNNGKFHYNNPTLVEVNLTPALTCTFRKVAPTLNITSVNGRSFNFVADPGDNYGPAFGVYVAHGDAAKVKSFCNSGSDHRGVDREMEPSKNVAAEFDCL